LKNKDFPLKQLALLKFIWSTNNTKIKYFTDTNF